VFQWISPFAEQERWPCLSPPAVIQTDKKEEEKDVVMENSESTSVKIVRENDILTDGLEIRRRGDKDCRVIFEIYPSGWIRIDDKGVSQIHPSPNAPCKVSTQLGELLGLRTVAMNEFHQSTSSEQFHTQREILGCFTHYLRVLFFCLSLFYCHH